MKTIDTQKIIKEVLNNHGIGGQLEENTTSDLLSLITTIIKEAMPYPVIEDELMEWDEGFNQYRQQLINNLRKRGIEV